MSSSEDSRGASVTAQELRTAASRVRCSLDAGPVDYLVLTALAQVLERLEEIESGIGAFECRGGKCIYE